MSGDLGIPGIKAQAAAGKREILPAYLYAVFVKQGRFRKAGGGANCHYASSYIISFPVRSISLTKGLSL
jgi:hypothetical protein